MLAWWAPPFLLSLLIAHKAKCSEFSINALLKKAQRMMMIVVVLVVVGVSVVHMEQFIDRGMFRPHEARGCSAQNGGRDGLGGDPRALLIEASKFKQLN